MPRYYNNIVKPSANKAEAPGQEKKGGKPGKPATPPDPGKGDDKTGEGAGK